MNQVQQTLVVLIDVAAPALIGGLALMDRSERYQHLGRTLTGLPLLWSILLAKALLIGVDLGVSSPYALAAMSAPITMYLVVGEMAALRHRTEVVIVAGLAAYLVSAYVLVTLAPHMPPLFWAILCFFAQGACRKRLEQIERWSVNHSLSLANPESIRMMVLTRMSMAFAIVTSIGYMKGLGASMALLLCVFPSASSVGIVFNLTGFGAKETCRYLIHALKFAPSLIVMVLALCYLKSCWESWVLASSLGMAVGLLLMRRLKK